MVGESRNLLDFSKFFVENRFASLLYSRTSDRPSLEIENGGPWPTKNPSPLTFLLLDGAHFVLKKLELGAQSWEYALRACLYLAVNVQRFPRLQLQFQAFLDQSGGDASAPFVTRHEDPGLCLLILPHPFAILVLGGQSAVAQFPLLFLESVLLRVVLEQRSRYHRFIRLRPPDHLVAPGFLLLLLRFTRDAAVHLEIRIRANRVRGNARVRRILLVHRAPRPLRNVQIVLFPGHRWLKYNKESLVSSRTNN